MKLLVKTNIYYIVFSFLAFIICGIIFYVVISKNIYDEVDENLHNKKLQVENILKKTDSLPDLYYAFDTNTTVKLTPEVKPERFIDTTYYSSEEKDDVRYRILVFTEKFNHKIYQFKISESLIESEDIIQGIIESMLAVFIILIIILFSFNYFSSKKIWRPFYKTLQKLENFDLSKNSKLEITESNITEFKKLNTTLQIMSSKILRDFSIQKEFSENASHEMQTPLAIIKSKLELLIQSENFTEDQVTLLQDISDTLNRLSRINQALLLITKIENKQYPVKENIDIGMVIRKHLQHFEELITEKSIETKIQLQSSTRIDMNPLLADMLVSNLISNAIRHNVVNGKLFISLTDHFLKFENTGLPLNFNPDSMFDRFRKGTQNSNSLGLGLSIVKKIVESSGMRIEYTFENNLHLFQLVF
jgi:signal transduction histidine kinase